MKEITKEEYYRLRCAEMKLSMLEVAGVDNWVAYGDALNPDGEESYSECKANIKAEIFGTTEAA